MAELNSSAGNLRGKGRTTTLSPRVDMTPMVDLMFLLITFFMLTTTLAKPFAMSLAMPVDSDTPGKIPDNRTMNLCIGKNNQLQWYIGNADAPLNAPAIINISAHEVRKLLSSQSKKIKEEMRNTGKGLIVLIKPTDISAYKNLVDVLDELKITGIDNYMIIDALPKDLERMKSSGIY